MKAHYDAIPIRRVKHVTETAGVFATGLTFGALINGAKRLAGRPHSATMLERARQSITHAGFDQASNSLSHSGFVRLLVRPGLECCARLL